MVLEVVNADSVCKRCGKKSMLTDDVTGERFCGKCGFVISETLQDAGPEWRSFSKEGEQTQQELVHQLHLQCMTEDWQLSSIQ